MLKTVIVYCNSENQHGPWEIARAVRQIGKFVDFLFSFILIANKTNADISRNDLVIKCLSFPVSVADIEGTSLFNTGFFWHAFFPCKIIF